ncbi:hypothetical protein [Elizabethkingia meningoseptica]|uniref:Uncharacterized protein n=1 Tax=Elizabethkingia meningoseptica TaxID=238 RepID=A0A1T3FL10_ELIME|nr:hypothetical protein [Elizabethkingia meningoseptica]AQX13498.1 hypothetical protein BBD35_14450 [Elizabethkingia meningoseptica]MBG0515144.1 hypothetical protein [Elizabethkingia meningoseptica]MDE5434356.1 hypothetical protein [Elizabethkingia meningoseptica]OOH96216.1 hypothetical protein BMF97_07660 [Elizabethkingia meningoseptica]OPB78446.1 hypothetical protein BAY31_17005 [Elizabethkingia meningoseptica]
MENQLIYRDESKINEAISEVQEKAEFLQENLNAIFELKKTPVNIADLDILFRNPTAFFIDIIVPEGSTINGLSLSKDKLFDLLALPDDIKINIRKIEDFIQNWSNTGKYLQYLEVKENQLKVKESYKSSLENQYSIFLKTEKDKNIYTAVIDIQKSMQTIVDNLESKQLFSLDLMKKIFKIGQDFSGIPTEGREIFSINYQFFNK